MPPKFLALRCEVHDALAPDARLIELAAVTVQLGCITHERFHALLDPQTPIPRSGTLAHGHSNTSLAACPAWREVAARWQACVRGAHLLVWNAHFHLGCLDRAQHRCKLPATHTLVQGISDVREVMHRRPNNAHASWQDALAAHQIPSAPGHDGLLQEAEQLARLWLALTGAGQPDTADGRLSEPPKR